MTLILFVSVSFTCNLGTLHKNYDIANNLHIPIFPVYAILDRRLYVQDLILPGYSQTNAITPRQVELVALICK